MDMTARLIGILVAVLVAMTMAPTIVSYVTKSKTVYTVTGEWHNNTSTGTVITVSNYPVVEGSETLKAYNVSDGSLLGTLVKDTNYTVISYWNGQFNITDLGEVSSANIKVDYQWHEKSYLSSAGERVIAGLITLFLFLGMAYWVGNQFGMI